MSVTDPQHCMKVFVSFSPLYVQVLQDTLPTIKTEEHLAIFIHNIFTQCYTKFTEPYRTKCMMLWLEYEASVIRLNHGKAAKELRKDLKKLVRCLLKEDRNNLHLVVKFAELEYQMEGYTPAHNLLETAILASNSGFLKQKTGDDFLSTTLLYRAAVELELREVRTIVLHSVSRCSFSQITLFLPLFCSVCICFCVFVPFFCILI